MTPYKLFVSYSVAEGALASEVRRIINDAFKGSVDFFFSSDDILAGDAWKKKISTGLQECDAILLILTPNYVKRPWAYIEWSAFWLAEKKSYIVTTPDINIQELVSPMLDSQTINLFTAEGTKKLMEAITDAVNKRDLNQKIPVPFQKANELAIVSEQIYNNLKENEEKTRYSPYKNNIELLPNDDIKKKEIFWYFYSQESDEITAAQVFGRINDNSIKGDVLQQLVEKSDYEFIEKNFESVEAKNNLLPLLKALVSAGQENSLLLEKILDYIQVNQSALRSFGEFLVSNMGQESKALSSLPSLFTNMAELRKLGQFLIDNSYARSAIFDKVVNTMAGKNNAEWQKLLIYLIGAERNYNAAEMKEQVEKLAAFNQREAAKVLIVLIDRDIETAKALIYNKKVINIPDILARLEIWIKEKEGKK